MNRVAVEQAIAYGGKRPRREGRRDCTHTRSPHRHGTIRAYKMDLCGCFACRVAHAAYARSRRAGKPEPDGGWCVPAAGTRRRVQALAANGVTLREMAEASGGEMTAAAFAVQAGAPYRTVSTRVADVVRGVYDALWDYRPDTTAARKVRSNAHRRGYLPPLAWDDDTIDDPSAAPHRPIRGMAVVDEIAVAEAASGRRVRLTGAERVAAVRQLTELGLNAELIGERLGMNRPAVEKVRSRYGMTTRKGAA